MAQAVVELLEGLHRLGLQLEAAQLHIFREAGLELVPVPHVVLRGLDLFVGGTDQLHARSQRRQLDVQHHGGPFLVKRIDGIADLVQAGGPLIEDPRHNRGVCVTPDIDHCLHRVDQGPKGFGEEPHHASGQLHRSRHTGQHWHQASTHDGRDRPDHIHDDLPDRGGRRADRRQDRHHRAE